MGKHLTIEAKVNIVDAYLTDLTPMIDLAKQYGVCRQAIWRIIKKAGINISSQSRMDVSCATCGAEISRTRARIRNSLNQFCDYACYTAYLQAGNGKGAYTPSRQGQRLARAAVSKLFELLPGHIVHHEDRNCYHNSPSNLKVFRNQGDHIRYHRLGKGYVQPIWEGV